MGFDGYGPNLIILLPGQVVDSDPDGLLKAEAKIRKELMKPHTIGPFHITFMVEATLNEETE